MCYDVCQNERSFRVSSLEYLWILDRIANRKYGVGMKRETKSLTGYLHTRSRAVTTVTVLQQIRSSEAHHSPLTMTNYKCSQFMLKGVIPILANSKLKTQNSRRPL